MAEFLWTFGAQEMLKKVVKLAAEQIGLAWGLEKELLELREWLLKTETFLCDINTRKLHHDSVRLWVEKLQHLVHQADDLLDNLVYEDLRRKVEMEKMNKVWNFVFPSKHALVFRHKMAKKVKKIMDQLNKHDHEATRLGLLRDKSMKTVESDLSQVRGTVSEPDDFEAVGRDVEVSSIVKQVTEASNQHLASILPIVGIGGLGKTTLARLVFNHKMIKQHFNERVWVCVSEPFDINKILRAILQNLKGPFGGCKNREVLLRELQKEMYGKRYFLVLDDVWNEDSFLWEQLKNCLMGITEKSENSIVVTTRSAEVAKIMEQTLPSHHLSKFSDDQCWTLFIESANADALPMTSNLEVVREELVKKFGGIPLVARVLGSAVKFQEDYDRWVTILESVVRTPVHLQEKNFALPILKLSVDHLPSSLKQCFAYCSNFPKDFEFRKEQLIQMWMAQGFIQLQEGRSNKTMEDEGDRYFKILLSRCLFQDVIKDDRGRIISCKMHDLIHDITCDVAIDQKLQLDRPSNLSNEELWMNRSKHIASKMRTIICYEEVPHRIERVIHDKIVNFVYLRVLIMNSQPIYELPKSIGKLKHLRYLDISDCSIQKLPKSIVLLYHLQTLKIAGSPIEDLPENLRELVNLRHLEFTMVSLFVKIKMPSYVSQLTQLQTLSNFVVGFEKGCKITELGPLKNLKGSLKLFCLEQVESKEEAKAAKLAKKEKLDKLAFYWSYGRKMNRHNDLEVLEGLQPHKNLQSLEIENFQGVRLPDKIFVENLVTVELKNCNYSESLPMLGQLTNLKKLLIFKLDSVRSIGNEFYGNDYNERILFPKLEVFTLSMMEKLEQLWDEVRVASNVTTFPRLRSLQIHRCPRLLNIPDVFGSCDENGVKHLTYVDISHCCQLTKLPNGLQFCNSIQHLEINNGSNLSLNLQNKPMLCRLSIGPLHKLPEEVAHLVNLKAIKIFGCMTNYDFSLLMHLPSLTQLQLVNDELTSASQLPQQLEHFTALQLLSIENFGDIEALPEWLGNLASLGELVLFSCKKLKQLPSTEAMLRLTKLRALYVNECPQLQLGQGDTERAKLSHLPTIDVRLNYNFRPF